MKCKSCKNCRWVGCKHYGYDYATCEKYIDGRTVEVLPKEGK
jgi:hypothetical protein